MLYRRLLATTALGLGLIGTAHADPITGPYVSLGSGYNLAQDEHLRPSPGLGITGHTRYRFDDGFASVGAVGWGFGNGLRTEVEGHYTYSNVNNYVRTSAPFSTTGHTESYGSLVNVLYDIPLASFGVQSPVTPYVGVGAGYLWNHLSPLSSVDPGQDVLRVGGTNGSFAYQGIVGAAYDIHAFPGLAVTAEYRYLGQLNNEAYQGEQFSPSGLARGNARFDESSNHQFMVGLRYAFDQGSVRTQPVAQYTPEAPIPAPAPARTYLVFFDWDQASLSSRAREIVMDAAAASRAVSVTRIDVNGYTDTSSAQGGQAGARYNKALSLRRAQAVEAVLIQNGVPESIIAVYGYGQTHPMVPTGPNQREPQDRRVEIILH